MSIYRPLETTGVPPAVAQELQRIAEAFDTLEPKSVRGQLHRDLDKDIPRPQNGELGWTEWPSGCSMWHPVHQQWARLMTWHDGVAAAYGQVTLDTPVLLGALGAGWQQLPFDTDGAGLYVTPDQANNRLSIDNPSVYLLHHFLNLEHEESNQGRTTSVRYLVNGTPVGTGVPLAIGRNQPGLHFGVSVQLDARGLTPPLHLTVEMGGGSTITTPELESHVLGVTNIHALGLP